MIYYELAKPGIIYGNVLTAAAGFFFASALQIDWVLCATMLAGLSLSIASACVLNNVLDRDIDAKMGRTKNRAIPSGKITPRRATMIGIVLGIVGFGVLGVSTNFTALSVLLFGYGMYLLVYTYLKRRSTYFTYAGALAGAVPPVVGYTSVAGVLDAAAIALFLLLCFWQMAHFYAIAIYRKDEYAQASIPIYPLQKGVLRTKIEIHFFVLAFCVTAILLPFVHTVGYVYIPIVATASLLWLLAALRGLSTTEEIKWARQMFIVSLFVIILLCIGLSVH